MEFQLKKISRGGVNAALEKVELYRYLNEPEEAESICRDILAIEPQNQLAVRQLGLAITDQFEGGTRDRHVEVERLFQSLADPYERLYYSGLLYERRAKAQLVAGALPHTVGPLIEQAMRYFSEAEEIRPRGNDDSILRWNRCVRLLQELPAKEFEGERPWVGTLDTPPR